MPSSRARRYALTFYSAPDFVIEENGPISYFVSGKEECPETKRIHFQSYIEFDRPVTLKKLKVLVDDAKVHAERAMGSPAQNIKYCKKDDNVYREEGTPKQQGKRTDLIAFREHFRTKKLKTRDAIEDDSFLPLVAKYPRLSNSLELLYSVERCFVTELVVFWGVPGSGKSHKAYEEAKLLGPVYFKPEGPWWDGYDGQSVVIFEDFRGETSLAGLLRLADRYPLRVPVKGGFKQFNSKRIYITSNLDVCDWFNSEQRGYDVSLLALKRRITRKVHFSSPFSDLSIKN